MARQEFEYHPEAIAEASQAYLWYAERSEATADHFWEELRNARKAVTRRPEMWTPYLHGTRCYQLERFPFALVYIERSEGIIGIAVAHLKRRPGYWRKRLAN